MRKIIDAESIIPDLERFEKSYPTDNLPREAIKYLIEYRYISTKKNKKNVFLILKKVSRKYCSKYRLEFTYYNIRRCNGFKDLEYEKINTASIVYNQLLNMLFSVFRDKKTLTILEKINQKYIKKI